MTDPRGFAGQRIEDIASATDGVHTLTVALFEFADGSRSAYVVASEAHPGATESASLPLPLSEAVHLLLNVGGAETWRIIAREGPTSEA